MTVDCQWVEKNLEALFCDSLSDEESRFARAHMETCASCSKEAQSLRAIDPLIKNYFQRELEMARRPRAVHRMRVFGLTGTAVAGIAALVLLFGRAPETAPVVAPVVSPESTASVVPLPAPPPVKVQDEAEIVRTKPTTPDPNALADDRRQPAQRVTANAPDFLVTDPAGYAHTLDEYRGHVVLIAVWSREQGGSIANIERLYKANAANSKLRFLGVATEHGARPSNTTFPILYNQGSKLLGAKPGEFLLLDETGAIELRGSLSKDFDTLRTVLQKK